MAEQQFRLPDVGEGLTEAEILRWYVQPGDVITLNQMICEIETAKAAVELPSPFAGTVTSLLVPAGETIAVGTPIISIESEVVTTAEAEPSSTRTAVLVGYGVKEQSGGVRRQRRAVNPIDDGESVVFERHDGPIVAKPPVRKLARDLGVDLRRIRNTGGPVSRNDVMAASVSSHIVEAPAATSYDATREERLPIKGVVKEMAKAMSTSAFTAPHVAVWLKVDVTRTLKLVQRLRKDSDFEGVRVSPLLIVAAALIKTVQEFPKINSSWDEANQEIIVRGYVNLGIAAATPRGLLVPVIHESESMSLPDLGRALMALVDTSREGRTPPEKMKDGTITITNVGVLGVDGGTPILPPGQAGILAIGQISDAAWVRKGKIKIRPVCELTLSFDHRMIDGELGSRVLARVAELLEDPAELLTKE
ncbi:MAG TPA: dihydrolipoamide acetyltransferase family protein [Candidatus Nanopelagicaceae bacterium]|nr:dihydrolipoamide acetyltransferase family protein [Candidatus Nanopelagicaceae bacterium]